jgi:GT2 family glycosyltransferase
MKDIIDVETNLTADINVVMLVYDRPEYLDLTLHTLHLQSVNFKLHIISNNPKNNEFFIKIIERYREKGMQIFFFESDNKRMCSERYFYIKNYLSQSEYIIFIDDDVLLNDDSIEMLWNSREKNTMKVYQGRRFSIYDTEITKNVYTTSISKNHDEFSFGALNFGVIDTVYFKEYSPLFDIETKYPFLYIVDDVFLSWVVTTLGGKILNHRIYPNVNLGWDDKALFKKIENTAFNHYCFLDNISKFKRF